MGGVKDYLTGNLYESFKEQCINLLHEQEIKSNLKDWLKRQGENYVRGGSVENMDFAGLEDYLRSDIIKDAECYLYGKTEEREAARQTILMKATESAGANDEASRKKVESMVDSVLNMLHDDVQKHMNKQEQSILAEIDRKFDEWKQMLFDSGLVEANDSGNKKPIGIYHKPGRMAYYRETGNNVRLKQSFENNNRVMVLGMPGIGKTEGVLWYLDQVSFDTVIWLNFENLERAIDQMAEFFMTIEGKKGTWTGDRQDIAVSMLRKLADGMRGRKENVVVFDNVNKKGLLKLLADQEFCCRIIVISCLNYHYGCFEEDEIVYWKELDMGSGVSLLKDVLNMNKPADSEEDEKALREIVRMSGGIPLIIRQAAAFIKELQMSLQQYLEQCKLAEKMLFEQYSKNQIDVWEKNWNVYVTFWLPYHEICEQGTEKEWPVRLLHSILFLNPDGMSEQFLMEAAGISFGQLTEGLPELLRYTLVRRENGKLYIKQVVQDVLRSFLSDQQRAQAALQIARALADGFSDVAPVLEKRKTYVELGGNAQRFISIIVHENISIEKMEDILRGIGLNYYFNGFYGMAERYLNEALGMAEMAENRKLYLRIYSELAELYEEAGDYQRAEAYVDKVHTHMEWILREAPEIAVHVWVVQMHLYENAVEDSKAMEKAEQVLELLKHTETGGNRSYFLTANICKINVYNRKRNYFDAEEVFDFVTGELKLSWKGQPASIEEANLYESRANTLLLQGNRKQAKDLYEELISIYLREYQNENHPLLAYPYGNIAIAYMENGELEEARGWLQKAEYILEKSDFQQHEVMTQIYYRHAMLEYNQGKYEVCYGLFKRAVQENRFLVDAQRRKNIEVRGYLMMACAKLGLQDWETAKNLLNRIISEESYEAGQKESASILLNMFDGFQQRIRGGERIEVLVSISG